LSTTKASAVSTVIDIGPHVSPSAKKRDSQDGDARATASTGAIGVQGMVGINRYAAESAVSTRFDETLPRNDFLRDLRREKRRAERSNAALSVVLYQADEEKIQTSGHADRLLELLHSMKRETDTLGHMGNNMFAVLCPDTDEHGAKSFMQKVDTRASALPFAAVASTYPDDLVENLVKDTRTPPSFQPFLVTDETKQGEGRYTLKRCLDIVGALIVICLLGSLMLVVAAAIALTSRGPIIFKQTRLGKGGVPFTFYKFRSMVPNGDDGIHRQFVANLINGSQGQGAAAEAKSAPYKLQSDPRVTPVGRFIRKTSIDELPQLFNVLKGDMSLVGPRPPIPYEAAQYQPWHLRRIVSIKPGITGLWQVEGRSKVTFNDMVRMDLRYIRDCSLAMDLRILLRTLLVVVRGDGAR
jgi:lipopolysaccharide/colanic/teichoic acid biosynthesis glycosyltransferase